MLDKKISGNIYLKLDKLLGFAGIVVLLCYIFALAHKSIFDLDIWLHLKAGELIIQDRIVPSRDIFSFTLAGKPWVDHSWLFQVITYLVNARWQADGLILLQACVITLTFLVLFAIGYKSINSLLETAVFLLFVSLPAAGRFNIRPDIFSLLFFSIYLYFLRFELENRRIWLLVLVQILWVNIHGYFVLGPLLVFLFMTAEFLRRKAKFLPWHWRDEFPLSDRAYGSLKQLFLLLILASFLNPRGLEGAMYPLRVFTETLSGSNKIFFTYIEELHPTFQAYSSLRDYYNIMLIFCFSLMLLNFKRLKVVEILLMLFFFFFSLSLRNAPYILFISYLITVSYVGKTLSRMTANVEFRTPSKQLFYYFIKCGAQVMYIVWVMTRLNAVLLNGYYDFEDKQTKSLLTGIEQKNYPKAAVDFIIQNNIEPNILNDFNSGAYLIGRAYPRIRVFIDGRTEFYGVEFFRQYHRLMDGNASVFENAVKKYNLNAILISTTSVFVPQILGYIYKSQQWKLVFFNNTGLVFLKDTPSNQGLIKKYTLDLKRYSVPPIELGGLGTRWVYPVPYLQRASVLYALREEEAVILECKEALRIIPNCAEAYHFLGKVYLRKQLYQEALANLRAAAMLMPQNTEALNQLGICFRGLKDDQSAMAMFKRAIIIDKQYAPAYLSLGAVYLDLKNEDQAIKLFDKAKKYAPEIAICRFRLGEAFYAKWQKSKDSAYLKKARDEFNTAAGLNQNDQDLSKKIKEQLKEIALQAI